ncbi:hypothetical protein HPB50_003524 [Hyalomma asiaticum]|uniref:Uncharacterized protein n=1 Tax=Hyalomma asiaticum TaxID=266040 RepID=A0ACB7SUS5_HYAAI|nr:hypothetical protein HPB50_003524 [Hyalomma asiaticum]
MEIPNGRGQHPLSRGICRRSSLPSSLGARYVIPGSMLRPASQAVPPDFTDAVEKRRRLEVNHSGSQKAKKWPMSMIRAPPSGAQQGSSTVPYWIKLIGRDVTPHRSRSLISKKGNYRYFFRRSCQEFGIDVVSEEISDDNKLEPLWEGKILAMVEPVD